MSGRCTVLRPMPSPHLADYVARFAHSALADSATLLPWELTAHAAEVVMRLLASTDTAYEIAGDIARHPSARIERGAAARGPAVVGPGCLGAAAAYLRAGVWPEEDWVVGPHAEVKARSLFRAARLAHLNSVGASIRGEDVNLGAGGVIANRRNERADPRI